MLPLTVYFPSRKGGIKEYGNIICRLFWRYMETKGIFIRIKKPSIAIANC